MKRLHTLDGLRGVAAASVVLFHYGKSGLLPDYVPNAPLAVDFFFILSGFVIAHAYGTALEKGLGWRRFAARRLIRLYPLIALGTGLGVVSVCLRYVFDRATVDSWPQIVVAAALNAAVLPTPLGGPASHYALFPGNTPLWSLSFELALNLLWAAGLYRLPKAGTVAMALVSAILVAYVVWRAGTIDLGFSKGSMIGGIARAVFGFSAGLILRTVAGIKHLPNLPLPTWALGFVLLAIFAIDPNQFGSFGAIWSVFCVFIILPGIVLTGAVQSNECQVDKLFGELSYPVYVLHAPILVAAQEVARLQISSFPTAAIAMISLCVTLIMSYVVHNRYDMPLRSTLAALRTRGQTLQVS